MIRREVDPEAAATAQDQEEQLTNADYFWDWEG